MLATWLASANGNRGKYASPLLATSHNFAAVHSQTDPSRAPTPRIDPKLLGTTQQALGLASVHLDAVAFEIAKAPKIRRPRVPSLGAFGVPTHSSRAVHGNCIIDACPPVRSRGPASRSRCHVQLSVAASVRQRAGWAPHPCLAVGTSGGCVDALQLRSQYRRGPPGRTSTARAQSGRLVSTVAPHRETVGAAWNAGHRRGSGPP